MLSILEKTLSTSVLKYITFDPYHEYHNPQQLVTIISKLELGEREGGKVSRMWIISPVKESIDAVLVHHEEEIENQVGVKVLGSGLNRGFGKRCDVPCENCCCSPKIGFSGQYSLEQTDSLTLVGPNLNLDANCKCLNSSTTNSENNVNGNRGNRTFSKAHLQKNDRSNLLVRNNTGIRKKDFSIPFAHARTSERRNWALLECNELTCLNGGRCLPSYPGYK